MVIRIKKKGRKYLGTRRWGVGNIKNARGAGERGGVGLGGRKHNWTHIVKYEKERIRSKGFTQWEHVNLKEIDLDVLSKRAEEAKDAKPTIELRGYKVLSDGMLRKPAIIKAAGFSKKAMEKIKQAGGEAIKL